MLVTRSGWGSLRQAITAANADALAVQVTGEEERSPTFVLASWWKAAPAPLEQAGQARLVVYQGTAPLVPIGALDARSLESLGFARHVWLDVPVGYGQPFNCAFSTGWEGPSGEHGLDWWAVVSAPVTQDGAAIIDAISTLTFWGFERSPSWRIR
jgi:hypothetical protein